MRVPPFVIRTFVFLLAGGLVFFLCLVFIPRTYPVPHQRGREATQYWQLGTGSRIAYVQIKARGDRKPFPVIFLQGGPGGALSDRVISELGQLADDGYDVYLYDQIGSGHSARLDDIRQYTPDRHRRDLAALIDTLDSPKVVLIGHSWGATLAALYVAGHPEKVAKLLLTGPGPLIPIRHELAAVKSPDSLNLHPPLFSNRQANEKVANIRSQATAWFATRAGRKLASDAEADDFQTLLDHELNKSTVPDPDQAPPAEGGGGYYAQIMTVHAFNTTPDPRPKLRHCPVPLLVIKGQYDNQKWGFTQEYLELFTNHRLVVVKGAGHAISSGQPSEYLHLVRQFLAE